jgi:lipoate-protein ligase A
MSRARWELVLDPALDGVTNMTVDSGLLSEVEQSDLPLTVLRFYAWVQPTISLGRNQNKEKAVDLEFCNSHGLSVVQRPTGGRAVLHGDELTYAIASNDPSQFEGGAIYGTYRRISEALSLGYCRLGIESILSAETVRRNGPKRSQNAAYDDPCFVSPSRYELMVDGRKLMGSAQRRLRRGFLQHGSMPITCDRDLLARATRFEDPEALEGGMLGIADCLDAYPGMEAMVAVFVQAFEDYFETRFERRRGMSVPAAG